MARNLLQIIQAAQQELGLPVTSAVVGSSDVTTQQMYALAQFEIEDLQQRHRWTELQAEYNLIVNTPITVTGNITANSPVITGISPNTTGLIAQYFTVAALGTPVPARVLSVNSSTQITMTMEATGTATGATIVFAQDTYPEPSDFSYFTNQTWYDRTNRWSLIGPDSPQLDQFHRSGIVALGPRRHFRQLGFGANTYRLWPPPAEIIAPLQLVFEYISTNTVLTGGNVATPSMFWSSDTDTPILNDRAIIMGVKFRFWQQKGFGYAQLRKDYDDYVDRLIARDGGAKTLSLAPRPDNLYITANNVQDSYFPGPSGPNVG